MTDPLGSPSPRRRLPPAVWRMARALFGNTARIGLYEQLEQAARSGMREGEAVAFIRAIRTRGGTRNLFTPAVLFCEDAIHALAQEGRTLPEVALRWSGSFERPLLAAAGKSGGTPELYREMVRQLRTIQRLRGALAGLLLHGALLAVVTCGSAAFTAYYFLPQLSAFIDPDALRGSARHLVRISLAFRAWWPTLLGASVLLAGAVWFALPRLTGPVRDRLDRVEPFRSYRAMAAGSFLTGAAALFRAGLNEREVLAALRRQASPYLADRIRQLERWDANFGERIARSPGDWPDFETRIAAAFAARQDDSATHYARMGDALVERIVKRFSRLSALSGWAANVVVAAVIIWILVATNDISASFQEARR